MFNVAKLYGSGIGKYPIFKQIYHLYVWYINKKYGNTYVKKHISVGKVTFDILLNIQRTLVAKDIILSGSYEPRITKLFTEKISMGDIVLDVGANIGYFTLLSSCLVGSTGKVYSFEPVKSVFDELRQNIHINNFNNVAINMFGLGSVDAEMTIHIDEINSGSNSLIKDNRSAGKTETVVIKTFDSISKDIDVKKISLIKIDVEGYEYEALKGMTSLLSLNDKVNIIIEFSPIIYNTLGDNYTNQFIDFIYAHGFTVIDIDTGHVIDLYNHKETNQINILLVK